MSAGHAHLGEPIEDPETITKLYQIALIRYNAAAQLRASDQIIEAASTYSLAFRNNRAYLSYASLSERLKQFSDLVSEHKEVNLKDFQNALISSAEIYRQQGNISAVNLTEIAIRACSKIIEFFLLKKSKEDKEKKKAGTEEFRRSMTELASSAKSIDGHNGQLEFTEDYRNNMEVLAKYAMHVHQNLYTPILDSIPYTNNEDELKQVVITQIKEILQGSFDPNIVFNNLDEYLIQHPHCTAEDFFDYVLDMESMDYNVYKPLYEALMARQDFNNPPPPPPAPGLKDVEAQKREGAPEVPAPPTTNK